MTTDVAVVTGTRAEYGLLRSVMSGIQKSNRLNLSLVVTGMHLSPQYGYTIEDIRADGFEVTRTVETLLDSDSGVGMAKSLGVGIAGLAEALDSINPNIVLVLGDRGEAFAGGIAAAHLDIPVGHIHGGDTMDGALIDDSIRHALTKFAHLHFPGSERAARRISQLGEEDWRIHPAGALALDEILTGEYTPSSDIYDSYDLSSDQPLVLVVQHPLTVASEGPADEMEATMEAVSAVDAQKIVVYPNSDSGGRKMIDVIQRYEDETSIQTFQSLPREDYLGLLAVADVLVGNSSSGIVEAPSLGVPVVDVGPRQQSRDRAENTVSTPHEETAIRDQVERCLEDADIRERARTCDNPYDFGGAADTIVSVLEETTIDRDLLRKKLDVADE